MSKEAMKLALEALEDTLSDDPYPYSLESKAITALREALAEQPAQQEPVYLVWLRAYCAWMHTDKESFDKISDDDRWVLYTSPPPQRTWVGLTDEDVRQCSRDVVAGGPENSVDRFAYAIEAKLRSKNEDRN
jgi:hypothetical protein